jgi:Domain of unknown function (DUF4177)
MTYEYKTIRLTRDDEAMTWAEEGESYSQQLTQVAAEGWELVSVDPWPWMVFRRTGLEQESEADPEPMGRHGTVPP